MAHHVEPMDVDSDFDNKENSLHHNNVLPFTEKGYEELDVSELNMKLRYSMTPASSPMSRSYPANCPDRSLESGDDSLNVTVNENVNLTRSLNSTMTKNDNVVKSLKSLPLQSIPSEQFTDSNRNTSVLRPLDSTISADNGNITVTVSGPTEIDENLSLPSSSSSALQTPEATTPTKDIPPKDGGSPIMRGLKSVLNMFRASQSPIPPAENDNTIKTEILSPQTDTEVTESKTASASTPISTHRKKEMSPTKRSPQKDSSIVFNEDLEKELQWKDETTIIFSQERIPIPKLLFQQPQDGKNLNKQAAEPMPNVQDLNATVEYMDISYNDSIRENTITEAETSNVKAENTFAGESDSEFVDCETTFTKNESQVIEDHDKTPLGNQTQDLDVTKEIENKNESGSRLKQIILDTTQDILDATLTVRPEDLLPEDETKDMSALVFNQTEVIEKSKDLPIFDQTVNITSPSGTKLDDPYSNNTIDIVPASNETFDVMSSANVTKPNEVQPTDQTFDIAQSAATLVSDQTFDVHSGNVTKTIEVLSTTQPIDQTFDITKAAGIMKSEMLSSTLIGDQTFEVPSSANVTKTIETLSITQPIDQTFDITKSADNTRTIEILTSTQVADQTFEVPMPADTTKTIEMKSGDQTFDMPSSVVTMDKKIEDLSVTNNKENNLEDTQMPEKQPIENLDLTITVNDRTFEAQALPVDSNIDINITETNLNNDVNKSGPIPIEENICESLPIPDNIQVNIDKELITELPVDIPLPDFDDDDLEKELNLDTESVTTTPPISLPLDLVDHIKMTEINEAVNDILTTTEEIKENLNSEMVLPEVCASIDTFKVDGGDINNQTIELVKDTCDIKEPEVPTPIDEKVTTVNAETNELNKIENLELNQTIEMIDLPELHHENVMPMDINESVYEFKPLPDIINQITVPETENIESLAAPKVESQQGGMGSEPANFEVLPETDNKQEVEKPEKSEAVIEINKLEELLLPGTPADLIPVEESPAKSITAVPTNSEVLISENMVNDEESKEIVEIMTKSTVSTIEQVMSGEGNQDTILDANAKPVEEEIIASENNSPFVSVIAENIPEIEPDMVANIENVEDPFATKTKVVITPPSSPPIRSKGYNFNFDDLDFDPFATKTAIRMSPPLDSPNKPVAQVKIADKPVPKKDINRRKSQPERKRPSTAPKRKFNATFDGSSNEKVEKPEEKVETSPVGDIKLDSPPNIALNPNNVTIEEEEIKEKVDTPTEVANVTKEIINNEPAIKLEDKIEQPIESSTEILKSGTESNTSDVKVTSSSSEVSTYYSAGASSSDSSIPSKNVFNLPEIDDINFNPFVTKSKMRQSPPPSLDVENVDNPFATKSKITSIPDSSMIIPQKEEPKTTLFEDKIESERMEKDVLGNLSSTTVSSKTTEKNASSIKTEDEDTVEGPFLEAEDLSPDNKELDFELNSDMMKFNESPTKFNEFPTQTNEENVDPGELFIDAAAYEFLLNQNNSNTVVDSGKESLFLKFDPLFAKRMSAITAEGVVASLAKLQKRQSTPTKATATQTPNKNMPSPVAGPSNLNVTQDMDVSEDLNDDFNITVSKPMMVVPPAVNPVTPRNKSLTPNRSNRRSITITSPAMAVIDRLLSLSGNNSLLHDNTGTQVSREQHEADMGLSQLRDLLAEKEIAVHTLRCESNELRDRLGTLESHVKSLETESENRLKKISNLNETLIEKTELNKSMAAVVEEYERTIAVLIAEIAEDKKKHAEERIKLINERDEQTAHLASMEVSFSDLHSKYEKSKQIILTCKSNEEVYMKSIKSFEENLTKMQNNYELLKQHATSKLNHANQELEKMNRSHEAEVLKLNTMIKRKDVHITSLEESLAQKTKANEELTAICDELINKVG